MPDHEQASLALVGLDLIYIRDLAISWEGWGSLALCVFLVALGWVETRGGGLETLAEIVRVDRLPED